MREILKEYGPGSVITIDTRSFGQADVPRLLDEWCTNQAIRATQHFQLSRDGALLFAWGCSYDDLWANAQETAFVESLCAKGLLRIGHRDAETARA